MKPLAINEHLKISLTEGKPLIQPSSASYGYNPLQIDAEVRKWQAKNPHHPRFSDSQLWLDAYQPTIDAWNKDLEWNRYQATLGKQIEEKTRLIKQWMILGLSRERAENNVSAMLFCRIRDDLKVLGFSDEEANESGVSAVRSLFGDLGYSDEQIPNRVIAVLKTAKKLDAL